MYFYKVRNNRDFQEYGCGPAPDAEAAIMHFNTQPEYGPKVGKAFTTEPTGTASADYVLIEQERRGGVGLHDIRSIPLYEKARS